MDSLRQKIDSFVEYRGRVDRHVLKAVEMKKECIQELEQFVPRSEYEKGKKLELIRRLQISLVEVRSAGNFKFYTTQLLAKEEEKDRGLSETQRKLNEMSKELRNLDVDQAAKQEMKHQIAENFRSPKEGKSRWDVKPGQGSEHKCFNNNQVGQGAYPKVENFNRDDRFNNKHYRREPYHGARKRQKQI